MKKIIPIIIFLLVLSGCGQGKTNNSQKNTSISGNINTNLSGDKNMDEVMKTIDNLLNDEEN